MKQIMDKGVLYKAAGDFFISEAEYSAKRSKEIMPDLPTAIITNKSIQSKYFDKIIIKEGMKEDVSSSILKPNEIPFNKTLFLDTDTFVYEPVYELFDILEEYDIAACYDGMPAPQLGDPFCMFNSGVILYENSKKVNDVLRDWNNLYWDKRSKSSVDQNEHTSYDSYSGRKKGKKSNQPSFAEAIFKSDLNLFVLPEYYNLNSRTGAISHDVKIFHQRPLHTKKEIGDKINKTDRVRVFYSEPPIFPNKAERINMWTFPASNKEDPIYKRVICSIKQNGLRYTLKASIFELLSKIYSRQKLKEAKHN